jgi:hypothetical protein
MIGYLESTLELATLLLGLAQPAGRIIVRTARHSGGDVSDSFLSRVSLKTWSLMMERAYQQLEVSAVANGATRMSPSFSRSA